MRRGTKPKPQREPTIPLINIVFLMLVFFMVAGTLSQPLDPRQQLVNTQDLEGRAPSDALVIFADRGRAFRGQDQPNAAVFLSTLSEEERDFVRLVPDQALPVKTLVSITRRLKAAGADKVVLVTRRGLQ